jgi:hypothetical protein
MKESEDMVVLYTPKKRVAIGVPIAELLENVEVSFAHSLIENKIWRDPSHVLCSAQILVPLIALPAKQNQRNLLVFIILFEINIHDETCMLPTFNLLMDILNICENFHKMGEGR